MKVEKRDSSCSHSKSVVYFQAPGAEKILETVYLATILPAHHAFSIFLILTLLLERFA